MQDEGHAQTCQQNLNYEETISQLRRVEKQLLTMKAQLHQMVLGKNYLLPLDADKVGVSPNRGKLHSKFCCAE